MIVRETTMTHDSSAVIDALGGGPAAVVGNSMGAAAAVLPRLREITGEAPTLVLSDDVGSGKRIEEFAASDSRWMVAVRMVSEGVDVPRLAVGVYATSTSTPLFFAQAVGRFVRSRRRGELASVFLPTVPILLAHAGALERQRDHYKHDIDVDEVLWEIFDPEVTPRFLTDLAQRGYFKHAREYGYLDFDISTVKDIGQQIDDGDLDLGFYHRMMGDDPDAGRPEEYRSKPSASRQRSLSY